MTAFFVPGAVEGEPAQRAYDRLRGAAEARTGVPPRRQMIFALSCRRDGADTNARVGEPDPCEGQTVLAIFAGREAYTIVWRGGHTEVRRREAYEAILFD